MFNIFRKKKNINPEDFEFLKNITLKLPRKYNNLINQIDPDFILDKKVNELGAEGTFRFVLNAKLEQKFADKKYPRFFIIKNIKIWNTLDNDFIEMELHILEGMLAGFTLNCPINQLNLNKINVENISEKHFLDKENLIIENTFKSFPQKIKDKLSLNSSFRIDVKEGSFYVFKDFKDGNYLAINKDGSVFALIHDPYKIKKIFDNVNLLLEYLKIESNDLEELNKIHE